MNNIMQMSYYKYCVNDVRQAMKYNRELKRRQRQSRVTLLAFKCNWNNTVALKSLK